jgi:RND superfamily putative drug exporter
MTVVFFAFTFTTDRNIKMIGLGMAAAVVIDALLVRTVLVPALMHTLGKANWRLPRILDRRLPHLDLEDSGEPGGGAGEDAAEGTGELRPAAKA